MTPAIADLVEMESREQANSKLWFTYRAGRVTASKMKSVCCTDSANPSQSLIKGLVYPEAFRFTSKYTAWGCKHEKRARDFYEKNMQDHHNFLVTNSGFRINPKWPHFGACLMVSSLVHVVEKVTLKLNIHTVIEVRKLMQTIIIGRTLA